MFKKFMIIILVMFATFVNAGEGSGWGTITEVNIPASGNMIRVRFSNTVKNPDGCGGGEFYMRELDSSDNNRFVSAVLAAYTAKKTVSFWISGCTKNAWWGATRPQLHDIYITD